MKDEEVIRALVGLQNPPFTFQLEKMLRRFLDDETSILMEGMNNIAQPGFAVAMQTRFMYDLEPDFGIDPPKYYFINASFLGPEVLSNHYEYEGIRLYFGIENIDKKNKLTLILTKVKVDSVRKDGFESKDYNYYIPKESHDGDWIEVDIDKVKELKDNLRVVVKKINESGKMRYHNDGYFIGNHVLRNVLSSSPSNDHNIDASKLGIKIYLGLSRDNLVNNYEKDLIDQNHTNIESLYRELQLIFVGLDNSELGPLASFSNIYATLETDIKKFVEGIEEPIPIHFMQVGMGNCVAPSPAISPRNRI